MTVCHVIKFAGNHSLDTSCTYKGLNAPVSVQSSHTLLTFPPLVFRSCAVSTSVILTRTHLLLNHYQNMQYRTAFTVYYKGWNMRVRGGLCCIVNIRQMRCLLNHMFVFSCWTSQMEPLQFSRIHHSQPSVATCSNTIFE